MVTNGFKALLLAVFAMGWLNASAADIVVPTNAVWKYLDNGTDQGTAWRAIAFNDTAWSNGVAQLGYGDGDEATVVGFGPDANNKYITTYFRHTFTVNNAFDLTNVLVRLLRDDGGVVYINGTEVLRDNLPAGTILYSTPAISAIEDGVAMANPPASLLVNGDNTIAVEIHQSGTNSTDISFSLELITNFQPVSPTVEIVSPTSGQVTAGNITVLATAGDLDGTVTNVSFFANGVKIGQDTSSPYTIVWLGVTPGTYTLVAEATDTLGLMTPSATIAINVVPPPQGTLITLGAEWRYLTPSNASPAAWFTTGFDDTGWSNGLAKLGYGDGDEATIIPFGPEAANKWPTAYFRKRFNVSNPGLYSGLSMTLVYDDGAVVYLNGQEIYRLNLPAGPIAFGTFALGAADYTPDVSSVNQGLLVAGENVIAVEMHQGNAGSSDLAFAMQLSGLVPPTVSIISPANGASFNAPVNFTITADASDDGTITGVEFYAGQTFLGFATNAPYSVTVTSLPEGPHALTAKANDNSSLSAVSAPVNITIVDPNPPSLVGANATTNGVSVVFSKSLINPSATALANYSISPSVTILSAQYGASSNVIQLNTALLTPGVNYILTVNNVRDRANNPIAPNSQIAFEVVGFTSRDIGNPAIAGSSTLVAGGFDITAAGSDIGGTSDQFHYNYESSKRFGDFDLRVRVASLSMSDAWAKAALMARETLDANSRFAAAVGTPGVSGSFFQSRLTVGGTVTNVGYAPATYPNTWLRLRRQGTTLTGYASTDGSAWATLSSITFPTLPDDLYVGMAVTSRRTTQPATAEFRDFSVVSGGTIGGLVLKREALGPSSRKTGLVISEIMYHPRVTEPGSETILNTEFIELHNSNPYPEDLTDHRISGAVEYRFPAGTVIPPGGFLVVARSPADVMSHYGISGVLGPWDGAETNGLPGGGGRVRLRSEGDSVLLEVNYEVDPPWPVSPDGGGHSLVLARPSYGENDVRAWAASDSIDGSPGEADPYGSDALANVVINELLANTDEPAEDFVELYNHGNQSVNLSGAYLTDESDAALTNQYQIPNGTIIPARGYIQFTQTTLGFALSSDGERVMLVNSNRTRVIDAVKFDAQGTGVSSGRFPDGGDAWYRMASTTAGDANSGLRDDPIVINEIMYSPITGQDDDEFLELKNRSNQAVDVSGWRLVDGIDFTIPQGTIIGANGYLVVARNAAHLRSNYGHLNTTNAVGDYDGSLGNGGERLALAMPEYEVFTNASGNLRTNVAYVVVNEVTYGDDGRWGNWSDGGGSSLELKDARSDNRQAANWADSDESSKGIWTTIEGIGTLGESLGAPVNDNLQIFLLGIGECLVDEVEMRSSRGAGANVVLNPGFETDLTSWFPQGSHDHSVISTEAFAGAKALHLRAASRGDNGGNRIRSAPAAASGDMLLRARVKWLRGWPEILLRVHGGTFEAGGRMNIQPNLGSPGLANSKAAPNVGPAIYDVAHAPILPAGNEAIVITTKASDPDGVALALKYRIEPGSTYSTVAMVDNGTGGDSVAGDGIYSATVVGQPTGTRMGFYIEGTDGFSAVNTFPQDIFPTPPHTRVFPLDASNRECMVRWGETQMPGSLGTYHLWLNAANTARWNTRRPVLNNAPLDGTFVYNNARVIYNMRPQFAGSPWHRGQMNTGPDGSQRVDYDIEFPNDNKFLGASDAVWNNPGNPGGADTSDTSAQTEQSSYTIFKEIGLQYNYRRFVHVFVNGSHRSTRSSAAGNFIFEDSQQANSDIVEQWFPDDTAGQLYKIEDWFEFPDNGDDFTANNDADLGRRVQNTYATPSSTAVPAFQTSAYRFMWRRRAVSAGESANDYSALFAILNSASPASNPNGPINVAAISSVIDWEQWMRIFAVQHTIGNWDAYGYRRGKNAYMYIGQDHRNKFHQWTWDIDFTMGIGGDGTGQDLFESTDPRIIEMWLTGPILRAYWRAFYDIIHGPLNSSFMDPILDAKAAALRDNNVNFNPAAVTTIKNFVNGRRTYLSGRLTTLTNAGFSATASTPSATGNTVTLSGGAAVQVQEIRVNGVAYATTWTGPNLAGTRAPTNWTMVVTLEPGANVLNVQGFDNKGNAVPNTSRTLNVQYNGPGASPVGSLVISEIMYNSSVPDADFVEIMNLSTNFAFDVSGWRVNGLDFIFPNGTIITPGSTIVLVNDPTAFTSAYVSSAPLLVFDGSLDNGGETITLIKPGGTPAEDLVVDRVKYDDVAPWPLAADGTGASLSAIDLREDNARVSNWTDAQGWRYVTLLGTNQGSATPATRGTNFFIFMAAAGEVHLDDMKMVLGTVPEAGENILANGDFEAPLTGTWTAVGNHAGSARSTSIARSGTGSLRVSATAQGNATAHYIRQFIPGNTTNALYTLSFWLLPSTNGTTLTIRTAPGSSFNFANVSIRPILATPGAANALSMDLPPYPDLWLNEVQAVNQTGIPDNFGDRDPWLELYNPSGSLINLEGYYLANNFSNLTQWAFPAGSSINPGEFKIIWVDGETSESTPAQLHTSFGIAGPVGSVALARLVDNVPQIVDYLSYGGQQPSRSYGSFPDGQLFTRQVFFTTTPGAANIASGASVFVNEWMAVNGSTVQDPIDLQFEDWIELHNGGLDPADISGFTMTDSISTPREFVIPDGTVIPAGGYLLIWADNEEEQNAILNGQLHASFSLSANGDDIYLFSPAGVLLNHVNFGRQTNDISQGRFPDAGAGPYPYMIDPSPGAPNRLDTGGENNVPAISPIGDKYVILGQTLQFQVVASDPDAGQSLTYSISGAPAGAGINQNTGLFQYTPTPQQTPSVTSVTVTVADNGTPQRSANRNFGLYVSPPPTMAINRLDAESVTVGFPTVAGKNYQVEFKNELSQATWNPLGPPQLATGSSILVNDSFTGPHRFYRILVLD